MPFFSCQAPLGIPQGIRKALHPPSALPIPSRSKYQSEFIMLGLDIKDLAVVVQIGHLGLDILKNGLLGLL